MTMTATQRFARFALGVDVESVPTAVREAVSLHLLDALGCGLAAVATGTVPYALRLAEGAAPGPASVIGVPAAADPVSAALINGISIHALDYDDTHPASIAHVSAVVAPAALAAAEAHAADGAALAAALLAGNEVACRIGRPAGDEFHRRGFHPTAICGVFGATTAVARLTRLDEAATVNALGIAGSMAAGLMAYLSDGSDTKRVHAGWMAQSAHAAVRLARYGASGPAAVLEGANGVYRAFIERDDVDAAALTDDLGVSWETPNLAFKPYPACHFVHAPLDALVELQEQHGFGTREVERVTAFSPRAGIDLVGEPLSRKRRPATLYESKFSLPFAIAAQLHTGRVDASSFTPELLDDPQIAALARKVRCVARDYPTFPRSLPGGVLVELADGSRHERHLDHQRGGALNPMTNAEVVAKFRLNARGALLPTDAAALETAVLRLIEQPDLDALTMLRDAGPIQVT